MDEVKLPLMATSDSNVDKVEVPLMDEFQIITTEHGLLVFHACLSTLTEQEFSVKLPGKTSSISSRIFAILKYLMNRYELRLYM